jgi:hypothetical protein
MSFDLVKYHGHPSVVKEMSPFMLLEREVSERVDPIEVELCSERAKKAEKEARNAKREVKKAQTCCC